MIQDEIDRVVPFNQMTSDDISYFTAEDFNKVAQKLKNIYSMI
jgi:hypothetical protein